MADEYFKKISSTIIIVGLVVLSYLLLKPILMSIVIGIILAFIFTPIYDWVNKHIKMKNFTAFLMCLLLVLIIVLPLWYLAPVMINQSIKFYMASQQIDFITPLQKIFPSVFQSETFSAEIASTLRSFVTKTTNSMMNSLSNIILNFPTIFLQFIVVFFTFFFVLRDKENLISYIQSLIPFSKEVEKKLFKSSKDITVSVLYGQVVIGIVQGLVAGAGFFLFKVPNALLLTALAALAGIFPIIGTTIVWIPVAIYLVLAGNTFGALGVIIFGLISSIIENLVKPVFVSRRTQMNSSIILIGMIGGLFLFGIMGVILGPLILAYLLIILEVYRDKRVPGVFIENPESKSQA
jgi:predicted PurR-regulated permease PerM